MDSAGFRCYNSGMMPKNPQKLCSRPYGHDGVELSVIGMGGLVAKDEPQERANRIVAEAVEMGVNYFDVAPTYGDSEIKFGAALKPYRKNVFLACKTAERTAEKSRVELENSLQRLETDRLDLYQLHALNDREKDLDVAFAKGGAMETFIDAKKRGIVRYLGLSSHSAETALLAMDRYDFDSILFPINFVCWESSIGPQVVEKALSKKMSILAIKAMAMTRRADPTNRKDYPNCWYQPLSDMHAAELALRFTLSKPVTAAIPPANPELFKFAAGAAMNYAPLNDAEMAELKSLAAKTQHIFVAS